MMYRELSFVLLTFILRFINDGHHHRRGVENPGHRLLRARTARRRRLAHRLRRSDARVTLDPEQLRRTGGDPGAGPSAAPPAASPQAVADPGPTPPAPAPQHRPLPTRGDGWACPPSPLPERVAERLRASETPQPLRPLRYCPLHGWGPCPARTAAPPSEPPPRATGLATTGDADPQSTLDAPFRRSQALGHRISAAFAQPKRQPHGPPLGAPSFPPSSPDGLVGQDSTSTRGGCRSRARALTPSSPPLTPPGGTSPGRRGPARHGPARRGGAVRHPWAARPPAGVAANARRRGSTCPTGAAAGGGWGGRLGFPTLTARFLIRRFFTAWATARACGPPLAARAYGPRAQVRPPCALGRPPAVRHGALGRRACWADIRAWAA
jgi:hypothetical protein